MMKMKKIMTLMLALGLMVSAAACGAKEAEAVNEPVETEAAEAGGEEMSEVLKKIKDNGKLVLGTSADYPPFEFHVSVDGKDQIVGFDIDIAKEIAKELGVELEIKDMKFDGLLAALDQGVVDLVIAGMSPTPEREENADFSSIYYTAVQSLVVKTADQASITALSDLSGKKVGVQKGTIQETLAEEQMKGAEVVALGKITDIVLSLKSGRIDAAIIELPVAEKTVEANEDLSVSTISLDAGSKGKAVALKKGSEDLLAVVNQVIEKLVAEKTIDEFINAANKLADENQE
jgi:polar amino acid transport system substrate-binding protein